MTNTRNVYLQYRRGHHHQNEGYMKNAHAGMLTFSPQVAQYIKFEIPVLDSFVEKLKEEEEREINKLTRK